MPDYFKDGDLILNRFDLIPKDKGIFYTYDLILVEPEFFILNIIQLVIDRYRTCDKYNRNGIMKNNQDTTDKATLAAFREFPLKYSDRLK